MEGISTVFYKNKTIVIVDYSVVGTDKDKILGLVKAGTEEYQKYPPKSVLSIVNVDNVRFDMEVIDAFSKSRTQAGPYEKKVAIIGMKGLQKVVYNAIIQLTQRDTVQIFNSETEAKEWLVSD